MGRADEAPIAVEVVYCPRPGEADAARLVLPAGATLAQALRASGMLERHALSEATVTAGVWGRVQEPGCVLREGDRVEVYRPLRADPKEARRERFQRDKAASRGGSPKR